MQETDSKDLRQLEELYREAEYWQVNVGGKTIHAKRMAGKYRTFKWVAMTVWLSFFIGPYLRWEGQQAILFDIPTRQFHVFGLTILPQDVWMLAMALLFFALLLAFATSLAGRVYCGYFCFQTVWTDIFTWLEEKFEGSPAARARLSSQPMSWDKLFRKLPKHVIWILIGVFTGISFTLWFADAPTLWRQYLSLQAPMAAWGTVGIFTFFTYLFAGHLREQVCFWLCPYARIQGVMADRQTILPTYDFARGEPRGKLKKGSRDKGGELGDCIDCRQCVAVCPVGVDIRHGQQEGCITCALCIDACDAVMDKVDRPRGLVRYASLDEMDGLGTTVIWRRPRVIVYFGIMVSALAAIAWGLMSLGELELKVLHERQPLYVTLSDGAIQNRYELKILNKTGEDLNISIQARGHPQLLLRAREVAVSAGQLASVSVFVRIPARDLEQERIPVSFLVQDRDNPDLQASYSSMFFSPAR